MDQEKSNKFWLALEYILQRLKEPSSWAGIALFIGFFGLSEDTMSRILNNGPAVITALAALVAIFAPTSGRKALAEAREAKVIAQDASTTVTETLGTADLAASITGQGGLATATEFPPHGGQRS